MVKVVQSSIVAAGVLALGVLCVLVVAPAATPSTRWVAWLMGALMVATAILILSWTPALLREQREPGDFVPVGADGRAIVGTPTVQQLAATLTAALADSPYHVLTSPNAVRVEWNLGDIRYRSLLLTHRVKAFFRTDLVATGNPRVFRRVDALQHYDSTLGRIQTSSSGGRIVQVERRVDLAIGPDGLSKPVDYALDTRIATRAAQAALKSLGLRSALDLQSKIGLVAAGVGVLVAVLAPQLRF